MSRQRGERNWEDEIETQTALPIILPPTKTSRRSRFIIRDMGEGSYEVTNSTGYWWHIIREADGELCINETDCSLVTLNAYALRAVKNIRS